MSAPAAPPPKRAELVIRPAQPGDRSALETIASQVWGGEDYLPRVFAAWLGDPHGGFFVATVQDEVIGAAKVTRLAKGEWWLEGLRIDPAYQRQGYARILHHFVLNQVRRRGEGVLRFSTASLNAAVPLLSQETGFERVATYLPYGADALDEPVATLRRLGPDDAGRVWRWLNESAHFVACQRSYEHDWSFYFLSETRLAVHLAAEHVYGWGDLNGMLLINPPDADRWPGDPTLNIGYWDFPAADFMAAALDVRRLAAALHRERARIKLLDDYAAVQAVEAAGYTREWEGATWLYARPIKLVDRADVIHEDVLPEA